ncbi:transmembrane protein 116 [Hippocampus comes]|uniref:transmembrane protein 116 n=1 Tax=Hippocampus comes TaxID=109280 RepID=UPI00094EB721|nr:PREDICTED: transmembrane protein 116 [Hippocampus comes]
MHNTTRPHEWTQVLSALPWIHVVIALISALCSASIITCVTSRRLGGATSELRPLIHLAVSDLLLALCGLLGGALLVWHAGALAWYRLHAARQVVCMASFFYTLNYMWNVYARLRLNFWCVPHQLPAQISKRAIPTTNMTALLSGVIPPLLMAPVFIQARVGSCAGNCSDAYRCLLMPVGVLPVTAEQPIRACRLLLGYCGAVFLATFALTLVGMMVLMGKSRQVYRRVVTSHGYLGNQQRVSFRAMDLRMLAYFLSFALCWGPTASLVALRATRSSSDVEGVCTAVLYVTQAITSASPGILHFAALACGRGPPGRTLAWRDAHTQTPLLRAQKRPTRTYTT